jgi:hypothetical protein
VRMVAQSVMRMDTNAKVIRALGLDSPELELCRETFISQWNHFDFQVKTFQEARPLTGVKAGVFGEKVNVFKSRKPNNPSSVEFAHNV